MELNDVAQLDFIEQIKSFISDTILDLQKQESLPILLTPQPKNKQEMDWAFEAK